MVVCEHASVCFVINSYFLIILKRKKNIYLHNGHVRQASMSQYFDNLIWDTFL